MAKTIWIVERGTYSDYRVVGVFSTREKAQRVADAINTSDDYEKATVAEWPLNPWTDGIAKGYTVWTGEMLYDGTVERMAQTTFTGWGDSPSLWKRSTAPFYRGKNAKDCLSGRVFARNQRHAIKIFNEHRVRLIASGEWKES